MRHLIPIMLVFSLIFISGCVSIGDQPAVGCTSPEKAINGTCCFDNDDNGICDINERSCPASCDDAKVCTRDHCSLQTNFECAHDIIRPCCGNGECDTVEDNANECPQDCTVITMTDFLHFYSGPDYMDNDTFVFIHTGSNETDKKPDFYLNITATKVPLRNIRATYNCTDSATGHKQDSITVDRVEVVEGFPEFGYENMFNSVDYTIYSSFYSKELRTKIDVSLLEIGKTVEFRMRIFNKNYKVRTKLTCDFDFYFLEPLKHVKKKLKISYI